MGGGENLLGVPTFFSGIVGVDAHKPTQVSKTLCLPQVSHALKVFTKSEDAKTSEELNGQYALALYHMEQMSTSSSSNEIKIHFEKDGLLPKQNQE